MKAYEIISSLDYIQGCNFEYMGIGIPGPENKKRIRTNEFPTPADRVTGCCALGAIQLAYKGSAEGLIILREVMRAVRSYGYKNIMEFGDAHGQTKRLVYEFFKGLNV